MKRAIKILINNPIAANANAKEAIPPSAVQTTVITVLTMLSVSPITLNGSNILFIIEASILTKKLSNQNFVTECSTPQSQKENILATIAIGTP